MFLTGIGPSWLSAWLTPVWLVGFGALAGLAILSLLWGVLWLVSRDAARAVPMVLGEGILLPILLVTGLAASFGVVGLVIVRQPQGHLYSLQRLLSGSVGTQTRQYKISPPAAQRQEPAPQEISVAFHGDEVRQMRFRSDRDLLVTTPPEPHGIPAQHWVIMGGEELVWDRGQQPSNPLLGQSFDRLLVRYDGPDETTLRLTIRTQPVHPEVAVTPITAISVTGVFLLYFILRVAMPKVSAIALSTAKSEMSQPLFAILLVVGVFFLFLFIYLPYYTFDEDIKVLKDSGLTLIMVFCILQAIWAASTSVSEELEGRTALTVLSKPVGRRQFILGKFAGIVWTVAVMFIVLGFVFLITVAYKPIYDARETAEAEPPWQDCHREMMGTVPGMVLAFFETVVLAAISVAISTRLAMLANFLICFSIYVAGHLTPLVVQSSLGEFEPVQFIGQLVATVFPVLDHFNIQAAVATGAAVPYEYLAMALLYCILYSTVAMLLALVLFENRDLA